MMLQIGSAVVLLSVLLATATSAQDCGAVGQQLASTYRDWQSALDVNSEAEAAYSACVENQARPENRHAREHCREMYSKLQLARHNLQAAVSEYENWRQVGICVQQPGPSFGTIRPLGLWPPAE